MGSRNEGHFEPKFGRGERVVCVFRVLLTFWARFSLCGARQRRRCRGRPTRRTRIGLPPSPVSRVGTKEKGEGREEEDEGEGDGGFAWDGGGGEQGEREGGSAKLPQFSHFSSRYRDTTPDSLALPLLLLQHTSTPTATAPISPIWPIQLPCHPRYFAFLQDLLIQFGIAQLQNP